MLIDRVTLTLLVEITVQIVIQAATTILNNLRKSKESVSFLSISIQVRSDCDHLPSGGGICHANKSNQFLAEPKYCI